MEANFCYTRKMSVLALKQISIETSDNFAVSLEKGECI